MPEDQQPASAHRAFETAGEHVLTRVPRASPTSLVEKIRVSLLEERYDSMTHVAILDGARLAGVLTIENLFAAPKGSVAQEVMDPNPPVVAPDTDQEVAAWQVIRHGENALAVVDEEGNFVGFVPPHRLLAVLLWEHEEDMDRLGGFLRRTSEARILSLLFGITFVGVTALTIGLWLANQNPVTNPEADLGYFTLGAFIITTGFVVQLRTPEHKIDGVPQAVSGFSRSGSRG